MNHVFIYVLVTTTFSFLAGRDFKEKRMGFKDSLVMVAVMVLVFWLAYHAFVEVK